MDVGSISLAGSFIAAASTTDTNAFVSNDPRVEGFVEPQTIDRVRHVSEAARDALRGSASTSHLRTQLPVLASMRPGGSLEGSRESR